MAALAKLKSENPHIKTIVSIGGGSSSKEFPALAENETARQNFAQQARDFCDTHHFDGVDSEFLHLVCRLGRPDNFDQSTGNTLKLQRQDMIIYSSSEPFGKLFRLLIIS